MVPIAAFIDQRGLIRKILGKFYVSHFFGKLLNKKQGFQGDFFMKKIIISKFSRIFIFHYKQKI